MHADNKPDDVPKELKEAYVNSVKALYAEAERDALIWLSNGGRSRRLAAVDVQWSGSKDQMKVFSISDIGYRIFCLFRKGIRVETI